jgi:hypothetical protein
VVAQAVRLEKNQAVSDAPKIPSNAIEGLMQKAFREQTVSPGLFWDALLNANLAAPLAARQENEPETPDPTRLPLLLGEGEAGERVVWLFTSPEAMIEYTEQQLRYVSMASRDLLKIVLQSKNNIVLIGPDGITLKLHRDLVAALADGRVPTEPVEEIRTVPKESTIYVGPRSDDASVLEARFRNLFAAHPEVLEAAFVQIRDDAGSRLLLGLKLEDESRAAFQSIAALVAKSAEGALPPSKTMDITLSSGSLQDAFKKFGHPFYKAAIDDEDDEDQDDEDEEDDNHAPL